jgi:hypothetical protein
MSERNEIQTALTGLREARLMQRANEAAIPMKDLHESCRELAKETALEQSKLVKQFKQNIQEQLRLLQEELTEVEAEIEVLGEDVFDQEVRRQSLINLISNTKKELTLCN